MKYIKLFESYKDIEEICQKYSIKNYTINSDQTIDVNSDVYLYCKKLPEIPLQFGRINGYFTCHDNRIESLKGSPYYVQSFFSCKANKLISLEYCPKYIGGIFNCEDNHVYSLDGIGKVGSNIYCKNNPISELVNIFDESDAKLYMEYLDLYNFQKPDTNIIYKTRFMEALNDINISELPKLKNYIYV